MSVAGMEYHTSLWCDGTGRWEVKLWERRTPDAVAVIVFETFAWSFAAAEAIGVAWLRSPVAA